MKRKREGKREKGEVVREEGEEDMQRQKGSERDADMIR